MSNEIKIMFVIAFFSLSMGIITALEMINYLIIEPCERENARTLEQKCRLTAKVVKK